MISVNAKKALNAKGNVYHSPLPPHNRGRLEIFRTREPHPTGDSLIWAR